MPVPGPLGLKLSQPLEWYETVSKLSASDARVFTTSNSSTSSEPSRWRAARFKASRARKRPVQGKTTANEQRSGPWRKTTVNEQQLEPTRQTPASHCQESCQPLSGVMPAMVRSQESCQPRSGVAPAMVGLRSHASQPWSDSSRLPSININKYRPNINSLKYENMFLVTAMITSN